MTKTIATYAVSSGRILNLTALCQMKRRGKAHGLRLHVDGARLWNAAVALGLPPADTRLLARPLPVVFIRK